MSVLKTGRGRAGGGGVEYLTENCFSLRNVPGVLKRQKKKYFFWGDFYFKNVPGVLKRMQTKIYFSGGGGILGCLGRPTPPPGVVRGRKTIHFFL